MGWFGILNKPDINAGVKTARSTPNAVILDVRTKQEYAEMHIPGSIHIPLDALAKAEEQIPDKNTPIFVHCLSGARSMQAEQILKRMGYQKVTNIGGIQSYTGKTERGVGK